MTAEAMTAAAGPKPTTFIEARSLSERLAADVVIATEVFQWTGSFKFRAAFSVVRGVPHPSIIAASSGNFGQALALACQITGKRCTVVMPRNSVRMKVDAVRAYGAVADLVDTTVISRQERVLQLAAADPDAYVASPYDDPLVIAGNASLGRELAAAASKSGQGFDAIVLPIGGGGLASGVITGLRESGDHTRVWAAEPEMANDFAQSLLAGRIVSHGVEAQTIADGARTRSVGGRNWAILQHGVAGAIEVPEDAIREGVRLLSVLANVKSEPTGALAVGALLADPNRFRGARVCCVVSGGNADPAFYALLVSE